jgi:effector-binding domain-containing protein
MVIVGADVQVLTVAARPTAVVRRSTTWDEFPTLWKTLLDQVYEFLGSSEVRQSGHNVMLYKDDVPNVEIGVEVAGPFASEGSVVSSALPAGETAMIVHRGAYDGLRSAHQAVWDWCAANGRKMVGPRWEIYGDWQEDPAQLETEVYYLLRP